MLDMNIVEDENAIFEQELYINCSGNQSDSTWAITPLYDVGKNTIIATNNFTLIGKESS